MAKTLQKPLRYIAAVLLAAVLACSSLGMAACSNGSSSSSQTSGSTSSETADQATYEYTDDAGRTVTIPTADSLERIYFTDAQAQLFCYAIAPDLAAGSTLQFSDEELEYLPDGIEDLPYLGADAGGEQLNPEAIVAQDVQLIFMVTSFTPTDSDASFADELQQQTNIPVLVFDGSFDESANTLREIGKVLGEDARGEELADYCEGVLADVDAAIATVPESERKTVYYAEGSEGLETEAEDGGHFLAFKRAGAIDAAQGIDVGKASGMVEVNLEQVVNWNPDVIITMSEANGGAENVIKTSSDWAGIKAVQDGEVYTMPYLPYRWCDRPPSVNRYIGIQWIANTLDPDAYDVDMVEVTKEYYYLFFHSNLTDDQARTILGNQYV